MHLHIILCTQYMSQESTSSSRARHTPESKPFRTSNAALKCPSPTKPPAEQAFKQTNKHKNFLFPSHTRQPPPNPRLRKPESHPSCPRCICRTSQNRFAIDAHKVTLTLLHGVSSNIFPFRCVLFGGFGHMNDRHAIAHFSDLFLIHS